MARYSFSTTPVQKMREMSPKELLDSLHNLQGLRTTLDTEINMVLGMYIAIVREREQEHAEKTSEDPYTCECCGNILTHRKDVPALREAVLCFHCYSIHCQLCDWKGTVQEKNLPPKPERVVESTTEECECCQRKLIIRADGQRVCLHCKNSSCKTCDWQGLAIIIDKD
jgi:hypothetical protein